jgi:hypothetical protein
MNVALELRNEANGVYERQPEDRYQRLLLVGADHIEDLEERVERLRSLITAWADAQDAQRETKPTSLRWWTDKFDAELALRKAIGRGPKKRTIMPKRV